jgi:hypothetical protein
MKDLGFHNSFHWHSVIHNKAIAFGSNGTVSFGMAVTIDNIAVFVKIFDQPEKFLSARNSRNLNQKLNFKKRSKLFNDLSMLQKIRTLLMMTRNTS